MPTRTFSLLRAGRAPLQGSLAIAAIALAAFNIPSTRTTARETLAAAPSRALAQMPPPASPLPRPEPLLLRPVTSQTALAINAAIPIAALPNPAAAAFIAQPASMVDRMRSLDCLAQAVYYEARSESEGGQRAVAQVVLNRLRHPAYPASVCGVVYQGSERRTGCQFTFTCDGSLALRPVGAGWDRARRIAAETLAGKVYAEVGHATHYHTSQVLPYWAASLVKSAVVGAHIFYRWGGGWGRPAAFRQRYAGVEPAAVAKPAQIETGALLAARIEPDDAVIAPDDNLPKVKLTALGLPESPVREAYRNSGAWRAQPGAGLD